MKIEKEISPLTDLHIPSTLGSEFSARLPSDYSPPTLMVEGAESYPMIYSTDVHLTIRLRLSEVTRKQMTLLAGQALYEVLVEGLGIGDWMVLEFLYSYLLGSETDPLNKKLFKELQLLLLLKIVLLSGTWMGLEGKKELPEDIQILLRSSPVVPNRRTYYSRKVIFRLDNFLEVRIVPMDLFIERSKDTVRYSSYCKGYGESSRKGRRQKTRPSAELDGVPVDLEKERFNKIPLNEIGRILRTVLLEIKYTQKRT